MKHTKFKELEPREWRQLKDDWGNLANAFYYVKISGKRRSRETISKDAIRLAWNIFQNMGNGGEWNRGVYVYSTARIAEMVAWEGTEKSLKTRVNKARRELKNWGFIEEVKAGTGGNGYQNHAPTYYISFNFLGLLGREFHGSQGGSAPEGMKIRNATRAIGERDSTFRRGKHMSLPEGKEQSLTLCNKGLIQGRDTGDSAEPAGDGQVGGEISFDPSMSFEERGQRLAARTPDELRTEAENYRLGKATYYGREVSQGWGEFPEPTPAPF
ncbi:hypothetical protein ACUY3S_05410 [Corynebacterium resistens]